MQIPAYPPRFIKCNGTKLSLHFPPEMFSFFQLHINFRLHDVMKLNVWNKNPPLSSKQQEDDDDGTGGAHGLSSFQQISLRPSRNFRFRWTYVHLSKEVTRCAVCECSFPENIIWEILQSLGGEVFICCQMQWGRGVSGKNNGAQRKLKVSPLILWGVRLELVSMKMYRQ